MLVERVKSSPFYEESDAESRHGYFDKRPIIGRDTPINGGVYVGAGEREAIVVDDAKEQLLVDAYAELLERRIADVVKNDHRMNQGVLEDVFALVREKIPYSQAIVDEVYRKVLQSPNNPNHKVSLGSYILHKGGVCRHQALLGAYLLEKLAQEGILRGRVSVDRNTVPGKGGHAWIRYTGSHGVVSIIDPAQGYIGRLMDVKEDRWFYERPEDAKK